MSLKMLDRSRSEMVCSGLRHNVSIDCIKRLYIANIGSSILYMHICKVVCSDMY